MKMPSAGVLLAQVHSHGSDIDTIDVHLERPLRVLAGLHGKHPADCVHLLPLLFPLCGKAHALAAMQAIEAATSTLPEPAHVAARGTLALADALAAQVWRTCIDWSQLAGAAAEPGPVAQARRLVDSIARAAYPDGDWQRIGGGRLAPAAVALAAARDELRQLRTQLDLAGVQESLRAPMECAMQGTEPEWMGRVGGCFADMVDATGASFRALDAGLEAMLYLPPTASSPARPAPETGHGIGTSLTARGELCYEFAIDSARVVACRMSAPTDRAFAPEGPVVQLLQRLRRASDPLLAVRWVLAAYDPCIEVRVERAAG